MADLMINKLKWFLLGIVLILLLILYKVYNPNYNNLFPKCPLFVYTGIKCPGCGSQRAIHHLLNFEILKAINNNILAVIFIPYILLGFAFELIKKPTQKILKWRKIIFGRTAILIVLTVIITFWVFRNIKIYINKVIFLYT